MGPSLLSVLPEFQELRRGWRPRAATGMCRELFCGDVQVFVAPWAGPKVAGRFYVALFILNNEFKRGWRIRATLTNIFAV